MQRLNFSDIFQSRDTHKKVIKFGLALFLAMELFIYIGAANHTGKESWVNIYDSQGEKIYETPGTGLTKYEIHIFERSFGSLEQYRIRTETRNKEFPFRAWLAIAVGAPIGLALLIMYLLRAYLTFLGDDKTRDGDWNPTETNGPSHRAAARWFGWSRISIFHLGGFLIVCVLAVWLVPDYIADAAGGLLETILRFKWFFLSICAFLASLVVWVIYLRYRMSQRMMDRQMDLEKFRMEKQMMVEMQKLQTRALPQTTAREYGEPFNSSANDLSQKITDGILPGTVDDNNSTVRENSEEKMETAEAEGFADNPDRNGIWHFLKRKSG